MVLYSGPALATLGGITSQQMETIIAESIAESNQALINSAISAHFNPVHIGPVRHVAVVSVLRIISTMVLPPGGENVPVYEWTRARRDNGTLR